MKKLIRKEEHTKKIKLKDYRLIKLKAKSKGIEILLGEYVQIWCLNYIYAGRLVAVNESFIILEDPSVVYETGKLTDEKFKFVEPFGVNALGIQKNCIESWALAPQMVIK